MAASNNPYTPPQSDSEPFHRPAEPLVSPKAILFVAASAVVCGVAGTLIGAALGAFVPDYYRSMFSAGDGPTFNPVAVGIGQGLTQGIVVGLVLGVALIVVHYWHRPRRS